MSRLPYLTWPMTKHLKQRHCLLKIPLTVSLLALLMTSVILWRLKVPLTLFHVADDKISKTKTLPSKDSAHCISLGSVDGIGNSLRYSPGYHTQQQHWQSLNQFGLTRVFLSAPRYDRCAPLSNPSSCMLVNHGPSKQSSKEEYKPWKWGATARCYTSHTKTTLPTRKFVPRSIRQLDHTKTSC